MCADDIRCNKTYHQILKNVNWPQTKHTHYYFKHNRPNSKSFFSTCDQRYSVHSFLWIMKLLAFLFLFVFSWFCPFLIFHHLAREVFPLSLSMAFICISNESSGGFFLPSANSSFDSFAYKQRRRQFQMQTLNQTDWNDKSLEIWKKWVKFSGMFCTQGILIAA